METEIQQHGTQTETNLDSKNNKTPPPPQKNKLLLADEQRTADERWQEES